MAEAEPARSIAVFVGTTHERHWSARLLFCFVARRWLALAVLTAAPNLWLALLRSKTARNDIPARVSSKGSSPAPHLTSDQIDRIFSADRLAQVCHSFESTIRTQLSFSRRAGRAEGRAAVTCKALWGAYSCVKHLPCCRRRFTTPQRLRTSAEGPCACKGGRSISAEIDLMEETPCPCDGVSASGDFFRMEETPCPCDGVSASGDFLPDAERASTHTA